MSTKTHIYFRYRGNRFLKDAKFFVSGISCNDIKIQDLYGKKFSTSDDRGYKYAIEVGPGEYLKQTEKSGAKRTFYLGGHTGYTDKYHETFGSGDYCNSIKDKRSSRITYTFGGSVTKLLSITEPKTCYYEIKIRVGSDVTDCGSDHSNRSNV